jgi:uncharacterized protein (DUF488 family)
LSDDLPVGRVGLQQKNLRAGSIAGSALHTIGYQGLNLEQFLAALHAHEIETVVDVRELPLSRKRGFSKKALAAHLNLSGVRYIHVPALGCPRAIRYQYRADGDWRRYEAAFLEYLDTQGGALATLAATACKSKSALLCFEADANYCHRRIVADAVARLTDMPVVHIPHPSAVVA